MRRTLAEIALMLGAKVTGDGNVVIERLAGIDEAGAGDLTFVADRKLAAELGRIKASAALVSESIEPAPPVPHIRVKDAAIAMISLAERWLRELQRPYVGKHPTAVLGRGVGLGRNVSVGPYVVLEDGAQVGDDSVLQAHVSVGRDARIGKGCWIHPRVVIGDRCVLGDRVILQPGVVIGGDGFGYIQSEGRHRKIPQLGIVELGDDVEIGANSAVDRARFGRTAIGSGTKLDNLVHVGHNVKIGRHCLLISQVGIAGSTVIGDGVTIAGHAGIAPHLTIGSGATIGSQAVVYRDIGAGASVSGHPARDHRRNLREQAALRRLPELLQRVRELETRFGEGA
jgi:UDP-3-O-[3-hydroxymyristoyl] glucosamine N-acyltransferase